MSLDIAKHPLRKQTLPWLETTDIALKDFIKVFLKRNLNKPEELLKIRNHLIILHM